MVGTKPKQLEWKASQRGKLSSKWGAVTADRVKVEVKGHLTGDKSLLGAPVGQHDKL